MRAPFLQKVALKSPLPEGKFPFDVPVIRNGLNLNFDSPVTFICGENGSGKSTIIEALALHCGFNITGGSRNHALGESDSDVSPLLRHLQFSWSVKVLNGFFMRAESFFQFAGYIDELARETGQGIYRSYGGKSLHAQSHGEAFLSLFGNRIEKRGLYLLDEPEAALSPQRQLGLLGILDDLERTGDAQFIIATHSPLLMALPRSKLLFIRDGEISEEKFRSTTHYQVMARFFANPERYIADFLDS